MPRKRCPAGQVWSESEGRCVKQLPRSSHSGKPNSTFPHDERTEAIREKFIKRVEDGEIDAWELVKPADSKLVLWSYADSSYRYMDSYMRWDGTGIEPAVLSLVDFGVLLDNFEWEEYGDWETFIKAEGNEERVKEFIIDLWLEKNK